MNILKKTMAVLCVLTLTMIIASCSGSGNEKKDSISGKIDRQTTRTANKIVRKIRSPLQKARDTQKLGEKRLNDIDRTLGGQ